MKAFFAFLMILFLYTLELTGIGYLKFCVTFPEMHLNWYWFGIVLMGSILIATLVIGFPLIFTIWFFEKFLDWFEFNVAIPVSEMLLKFSKKNQDKI